MVAALTAAVLVGSQVLATAGPTTTPRVEHPVPAASSDSPDAGDEDGDGDCANQVCGSAHAKAVHAWVACKAAKGKDACEKPAPPGKALGHTKHAGTSPGPASAEGHGRGWGRAQAPGQLKNKDEGDRDADAPSD